MEQIDVLKAIRNEKPDTKPKMAKFLKQFVDSIGVVISQAKVEMWPKIQYSIWKCIVRFNDKSSLIKDFSRKQFDFVYESGFEFVDVSQSDKKIISEFFEYLEKFRFIRNGETDVRVFSSDVEKTNSQMQKEMECVKSVDQFIDYTPRIEVK